MSDAPRFDIDPLAFADDPYPTLARMRREAPICHVPQLGATLLTRRDDIFTCERNVEVFSSHQPGGLMNRLMGVNMMRKDGEAHRVERAAIFPTVSPKTVRDVWKAGFEADCAALLERLEPAAQCDLIEAFAMPLAGAALVRVTGLAEASPTDMDAWSQAMIDGIANYGGVAEVEERSHAATAAIDTAVELAASRMRRAPDFSLLSVMMQAGLPMDSIKANIRLAISGGQNEPRDAIAGCIHALLAHPREKAKIDSGTASWTQAFEEYTRWTAPIGMSPRRIARDHLFAGVTFETEDRAFLMFSSANRDEAHFDDPDRFRIGRDTSKAITFGAGPHFCAGAWVARALIAEVALPAVFAKLRGLRLARGADPRPVGWAFRGLAALPVAWDPAH